MNGMVATYNRMKGWGFAMPEDGSNDVFLHASNLPADHKYLHVGDKISFDIGTRNGRPLALNIRIVEDTHRVTVPNVLSGAPAARESTDVRK